MTVQTYSSFRQANPAMPNDHTLACARIVAIVARRRNVRHEAILTHSRSRKPVAVARQIAMYLSHVLLEISMTDVGRYFGRDRTTVAHACAVVEDMRDDPATEREIALLEKAILGFATVRRAPCSYNLQMERVHGH